ncbi:11770_t:CDS:2, partial [Racocetra persica]
MNFVQQTGVENEFLVLSTSQNNLFYIVNSEIGTCTCPMGMNGAPCKHQGAVAMKFHVRILNFLPSLIPSDRMIFTYIALGQVTKDSSFYASLRVESISQEYSQETRPSNERLLKPLDNEQSESDQTNEVINDTI